MARFKIGDKVRYLDGEGHERHPEYYPAVGTVGEIKQTDDDGDPWVQWPKGTTSHDDYWCCGHHRLELVTEGGTADA